MPSKKYEDFIEFDKLEKQGKKGKESLRPYVEKLLRRCRNLGVETPGFSFTIKRKFSFIEHKLYEWVKERVSPEVLQELTKKEIDLEKLNDAHINGIIDTTKISEDCYFEIETPTITVKHKKEK